MASVHREKVRGKLSYRVKWFDKDGRRRRLNFSNKRDAEHVANNIQTIVNSQIVGRPLEPSSIYWLDSLADPIHARLAKTGLCEPRVPEEDDVEDSQDVEDPVVRLVPFIDSYINGRKDAAANTVRNWRNSRDKLSNFFGADRPLEEITAGDADDWQQSLVNAGKAEATISKATKHAKQFFGYAVRKQYCPINPFGHLKAKGERNESRKFYVELPIIQKVIDACPTAEWRLIIALCRFGGLRCPSEVLGLKWEDISLDGMRMTVTSPKTKRYQKGERLVPIFGDLLPYLQDAREVAPKSKYLVTSYRDKQSNLRTQLERILKRAGVKPWTKLFHNMRASRQQQLIDAGFSPYVVCSWMGNTIQVSADHYEQVTDDHMRRATVFGAADSSQPKGPTLSPAEPCESAGPNVGPTLTESNGIEGNLCPASALRGLETPENPCFIGAEIPPRGVEPLSSD